MRAEAQIAEFIGAMVSAKEREESGESVTASKQATKSGESGEVSTQENNPVASLISRISREAKSSAKAHMAGM